MAMVLLLAGFVMLVKGADWFVEGASGIAEQFKIPQLVIGLTIVAMGTSAPEAAVSIAAALKGNGEITVGNIVGSNILNILVILGLSSLIMPMAVSKTMVYCEIPFMTAVTFLFLVQGMDGKVGRAEGLVLGFVFLGYLGYLLIKAKEGQGDGTRQKSVKQKALWWSVAGAVAGLVLIMIGSNLAVEAASTIARLLGISERFIGLTIVALGTSLPELVTSVLAALKGNGDIAIGNIVGSNIFNILFVGGTSALITPVPFSSEFYVDTAIAVLAGVLLWGCCVKSRRLDRVSGGMMLAGYLGYFGMICL